MSTILDIDGYRALQDPVINVQLGQEALVTELVLGQPQSLILPGDRLFPRTPVNSFEFSYEERGTEHLDDVDTERAMRAPIKIGDWKTETITKKLKRFSFGILRDEDEIGNAHPSLNVREISAALARRIVMLDLERRKRDLLVAVASYGDGVGSGDTDLTGSEWNAAGGDSFTDVRAACAIVSAATGFSYEELGVFLADDAYRAAQEDPTFRAARHNTTTNVGMQEILRDYWGVGEVWTANPIERVAGAVTPMYSDVVIIYYRGSTAMDTTFGDRRFAAGFAWNGGVASVPYFDPKHTSWVFPWTDYHLPRIVSPFSAHLLTGMVA